MVKRKRSDIESNDTSQRKIPSVIGMAARMTTPSILSAAETELRAVMDDFVNVYERLDQKDDVNTKPNYSYTELIYLAILRSPNFCLPITEIYKYIKNRFSYFRNPARKHWNNAVRHSLSKTKCFTKIAVGRGSSGNHQLNRSTYLWCTIPGSIVNFARGDYRPNVDTESGTNTLRWGYFRVNAGQFWEQVAEYLDKKMDIFKQMVMTTSSPGKVLEAQACYVAGTAHPVPVPSQLSNDIRNMGNLISASENPSHTVHYGPIQSLQSDKENLSNLKSTICSENVSTDSGNGSLEVSSPDVKRSCQSGDISQTTNSGMNLSLVPINSTLNDDSRKTPELPDLGHVSPLTISPSLSPICNMSGVYEQDSGVGQSLITNFSPVTSFASTPIVTSFHQPRFIPTQTAYINSISPPFSSVSPSSIQSESRSAFTQKSAMNSKPPSYPLIQSAFSLSPAYGAQNVYLARGSVSPPLYFPPQQNAGSYDFSPYVVHNVPAPHAQHEFMGHQSLDNSTNYMPYHFPSLRLDSVSPQPIGQTLEWPLH